VLLTFRVLQQSLLERLRMTPYERENLDAVPPHLFRKYVAYARRYVKPRCAPSLRTLAVFSYHSLCQLRLSSKAKEILSNFYLKLRSEHNSDDGTPITSRQLESLIRLSEARAKLELREIVTGQDAFVWHFSFPLSHTASSWISFLAGCRGNHEGVHV
jgi:DNA helicase MCM8